MRQPAGEPPTNRQLRADLKWTAADQGSITGCLMASISTPVVGYAVDLVELIHVLSYTL